MLGSVIKLKMFLATHIVIDDLPLSPNRNYLEICDGSEEGEANGVTKDENYDDEPDETLLERLIGLTEMFPESVRNATANIFECTVKGIQGLYQATCIASWVVFTSSIVLFAPVVFETERAQMDEMQKTQAKQVLLGPGSAIAAVGNSKNDLPALR